MRSVRNYVNTDGTTNIKSTFLSCEKDAETIVRKLFVDSRPYSDELKRLLLINTKDCLDDRTNPVYNEKISNTSLGDMIDEGYIRMKPLIKLGENEEVRSYICLSFDNFTPNANNTYYRNHIIEIDIICHIEKWDLDNFRLRPLKIAGYIDGILDQAKLAGIGTLDFITCNEIVLSEELAGYCLMYRTVNADDDKIESEEE